MKQFLKHQLTSTSISSQEQFLSKLFNSKQKYSQLQGKPFCADQLQKRTFITKKRFIDFDQSQNSNRGSSQNQKQGFRLLTSLLLIGSGSILIQKGLNSFNNQSMTAEAEEDQTYNLLKTRVHHSVKDFHLQLDSKKQTIFVYFDSQNALQAEFMHEIDVRSNFERMLKKYPNLDIVLVDVNSLKTDPLTQVGDIQDQTQKSNQLEKELMNIVDYPLDRISLKQKPTVFIKADDRIVKFKATLLNEDYFDKFNVNFQKESSFQVISSIKDLAELLKQFNTNLNSTTIVYCNDTSKSAASNKTRSVAMRLMRQETENPILQVNDASLAERLNMKPGRFYCYFKPSFINGFENFVDKDINFNYLQAYEQVGRDEFILNEEAVESEDLDNLLSKYRGFQTEKFATSHFDQFFTRSFTVEFTMNPNFQDFKKKFKQGTATRPLMFIYTPSIYMSRYIIDFKHVLQDYTDVFDVYYTDDEKQAKSIFHTTDFPDLFPFVVIIDPKKKKYLKSSSGELQELTIKNNNFYPQKYREIIFFNNIPLNLKKLIEKFLDGEASHFYQSEKLQQATFVKKICSANFEQKVLKNPNVQQCIVEVFKHDCPSCSFNGKVFNVLSRKLEKHGYLDQLPLFRLSIENRVPYLGVFKYSPIYLYVRKQGNEIVEIQTLEPPQKIDDFLAKISELSKLKGFKDKIKLKPREQVIKHIKLQDLDDDFDIDFDTIETKTEDKPAATPVKAPENTSIESKQQQQPEKKEGTQ